MNVGGRRMISGRRLSCLLAGQIAVKEDDVDRVLI